MIILNGAGSSTICTFGQDERFYNVFYSSG